MSIPSTFSISRFFNRTADTVADFWTSMVGPTEGDFVQSADLSEPDDRIVTETVRKCIDTRNQITERSMAARLGTIYTELNETGKRRFQKLLVDRFGPDISEMKSAVSDFSDRPEDPDAYNRLMEATDSPRIQFLKSLNALPDGIKFLIELREDCLKFQTDHPELEILDRDLYRLFDFWFDVNLLEFRRITWESPASLLEKLMMYEDVHSISDWEDLKDRLDHDRRVYALMHPKMPDEPLIFVEVALTSEIPESIHELLDPNAPVLDLDDARIATFYSISSTQKGLRGINFGHFLLKEVVKDLRRDLPHLEEFVTLSPVVGFREWLFDQIENGSDFVRDLFNQTNSNDSPREALSDPAPDSLEPYREPLLSLCAYYLSECRRDDGLPRDPVDRFHTRNGARIERLNWMANQSEQGLKQSLGLMVNYRYDLDSMEENHRKLMEEREVTASSGITKRAESIHS